MGISIRNHEGYLDPTTYEALTNVERERYEKAHPLAVRQFRPVVYICSPYAGAIPGNTDQARKYSRFAIEQGCIPITPHLLYPQFLDETQKQSFRFQMNYIPFPSVSLKSRVEYVKNSVTDAEDNLFPTTVSIIASIDYRSKKIKQ